MSQVDIPEIHCSSIIRREDLDTLVNNGPSQSTMVYHGPWYIHCTINTTNFPLYTMVYQGPPWSIVAPFGQPWTIHCPFTPFQILKSNQSQNSELGPLIKHDKGSLHHVPKYHGTPPPPPINHQADSKRASNNCYGSL